MVGLYTNQVNKSSVKASDFKEPPGYNRVTIQSREWKIDKDLGHAIGPTASFSFSGRAGKIVGYFIMAPNGAVIGYNASPDQVPASTNEDKINVRPRLRLKTASDLADSVAIGAAFSVLIDSTAMFPPVTDERLLEYVLDSSMDTRRREIARRSERTIHGSDWIEVETWDRVSHLFRSRLAWIESGGYLLVLSIDRGPFEEAAVAFEALLTSIQVTPGGPGPQ